LIKGVIVMAFNAHRLVRSRLGLAVALLTLCIVGPASADRSPVTPEQLKEYDAAFMAMVKKGDLLFHGDPTTIKQMGVNLSSTGMACAMCHPMASDTHPGSFPKFQASVGKFSTLRDMINWCIEKPNQGEQIDPESEAMKALETYIYWSNSGSVLDTGKY
jgi:thiosulfate dehydrogenase